MPRYNVYDEENKLWSCFSTVVEDFVSPWLPEDEYYEWRKQEYGKDCGPTREANLMTLDEALERKKLCRMHYGDKGLLLYSFGLL